VSSPVGAVIAAAKITESVSKGSVFMAASYLEAPVLGLFGFVADNKAKALAMKSCSVKLERMSADG